MVMNPRTHPRGAPPDFTLPRPNPNPTRMTDALWWLVCMREALEPASQNGGTYADKPGYHNAGENLPDHGLGNAKTDHSIRRRPDREGPWWKRFTSAHDWTFPDAQRGDYRTIDKYTTRLVNAMRDPKDLRPDDVYAYTLGQMDGDTVVEGYNEYTNMPETSADKSHNWHRHDGFRRNIIGNLWAMWKALTIDMGWSYTEWLHSTLPQVPPAKPPTQEELLGMELNTVLWDKTKPPAWAAPYRALMTTEGPEGPVEANPTVQNLLMHTLRHAGEANAKMDAFLADPDPDTEAETIRRGGFNPGTTP
jgi:hypothetical protein